MDKKTLLLLGYTGGIGYKTAEVLLKEGYSVIGTYNKQDSKSDPQGNFTKIQTDLSNLESIKSWPCTALEKPTMNICKH